MENPYRKVLFIYFFWPPQARVVLGQPNRTDGWAILASHRIDGWAVFRLPGNEKGLLVRIFGSHWRRSENKKKNEQRKGSASIMEKWTFQVGFLCAFLIHSSPLSLGFFFIFLFLSSLPIAWASVKRKNNICLE